MTPTDEQNHIAAALNACDREIESLEGHMGHQQDQKKGLIQQLLMGKTRVKVEIGKGEEN